MKKFFTLALTLFLACSLCLSVSAEGFTDAEDVTYKEAVGVMVGIGAMQGYEDGSVKPYGNITREEAAKLLAYAVLGSDAAQKLPYKYTGFTDVASGSWSEPFIAYLVDEGIVDGNGDGTFGRTDTTKGYEFAKMVLCAMGYGRNGEYKGSDWMARVASDANALGLFKGLENVNMSDAITREVAAQLAYNGLLLEKVVFDQESGKYVSAGHGSLGSEIHSAFFAQNPVVVIEDVTVAELIGTRYFAAKSTISLNGGQPAALNLNAGQTADVWVWNENALELLEGDHFSPNDYIGNADLGGYQSYVIPSDYIGAGASLAIAGSKAEIYDFNADGRVEHVGVITAK